MPTATLHEFGNRGQLFHRGSPGHLTSVKEESEERGLAGSLTSDHEGVPIQRPAHAAHNAAVGTAFASRAVANVACTVIICACAHGRDHELASIIHPGSIHPAVHDGHRLGLGWRGGDGGEGRDRVARNDNRRIQRKLDGSSKRMYIIYVNKSR